MLICLDIFINIASNTWEDYKLLTNKIVKKILSLSKKN